MWRNDSRREHVSRVNAPAHGPHGIRSSQRSHARAQRTIQPGELLRRDSDQRVVPRSPRLQPIAPHDVVSGFSRTPNALQPPVLDSCYKAVNRMADERSAPSCAKCGAPAVPSYLMLSPVLQYWRCPDCFGIWTTRRTPTEGRAANLDAKRLSVGSARTHCPECHAPDVADLNDVLYSRNVDYFRCRACDCWWMVPKGHNKPATRMKFGKTGGTATAEQAG